MTQSEPLLSIELNEDNGIFTIPNMEKLRSWIAEETQFWSWLTELQRTDNFFRNVSNSVNGPLSEIEQAIQHVPDGSKPEEGHLQQIKQAIQRAFRDAGIPLAESPRGQLIADLEEQDPTLAAMTAAAWISGASYNLQDDRVFRGRVIALLFDQGTYRAAASEKRSLSAMRARWEQLFSNVQESAKETITEKAGELDQLRNSFEKISSEIRRNAGGSSECFPGASRNVRGAPR